MNAIRLPAARSVAAATMLTALVVAQLPGRPTAVAVGLAGLGVVIAGVQLVPDAVRLLARRRSLVVALGLLLLVVAWIAVGVVSAGRPPTRFHAVPEGSLLGQFTAAEAGVEAASWPWRVQGVPLLPLLVVVLSGAGGFVLVSDAVRVAVGLARPPRSMWRTFTATPTRGGRTAARAVPGLALIGILVFSAIGLGSRVVTHEPVLETLGVLGIAALAALLLGGPVVVGLAMRIDVDKAGRAREEERVRFAAHLHDSVLQTLALIQRQSADPDAVSRLARRQEHALRAWMAGETESSGATVAAAVRDMVAEVEDDHAITVALTAIGDAALDPRGEQLVAAGREALRNAARHAAGASVNVFLDIDATRSEMFVRDDGPGFSLSRVPAERRGLRDSVIGRMTFAGGSAAVESAPGEGTEVVLRLPHDGRGR